MLAAPEGWHDPGAEARPDTELVTVTIDDTIAVSTQRAPW